MKKIAFARNVVNGLKWMGNFVRFVGQNSLKWTLNEPIIDEETGTETFDQERVESVEHPGVTDDEDLPPMVPPARPTPPPFQEKPFYVRHGKALVGVIIALVVA